MRYMIPVAWGSHNEGGEVAVFWLNGGLLAEGWAEDSDTRATSSHTVSEDSMGRKG